MLASEPVSKLSTQITRCPRASSSSQRCEPRKPAPPVTRQVDTPWTIPREADLDTHGSRWRAPVSRATVSGSRLCDPQGANPQKLAEALKVMIVVHDIEPGQLGGDDQSIRMAGR